MNSKKILPIIAFLFSYLNLNAQAVNISVDVNAGRKEISPLIYGMNNALSDDQSSPLGSADWQLLRDAGVRFVRELGGNNGTKYNWRLKLSSHPDWYNNVYKHNWNYAAQSLANNLPGVYGMWCFQLIGKAASNTNNNFNDYSYNGSSWWSGVSQNLAGGGTVNPSGGSKALVEGNPNLYLMNWTADSTVGILNYWFGNSGLKLNSSKFVYWSMDNEPEIWSGTHDDVMPTQCTAEEFMQKYFAVAKKARAILPSIKIVGPVPCNEWQWFNWNDATISYKGSNYCWLEYFIKRIAEEQTASGIRLLDVLDIHFYPTESDNNNILQMHRVFFDKSYVYAGANGVRNVTGSWDNSQNKEYIFARCNDWLTQYLGSSHGVKLSVSEMDINSSDANINANWYASTLGTFANNGVEFFTPWSWKKGMYEVLHLFSTYNKNISIQSTSSNETYLSAFASANTTNDSIIVILVNRSETQTYTTNIRVANYNLLNGDYKTLTLKSLPGSETFISKTNNALISSQSSANNGILTSSVAPLSIKAIIICGTPGALGLNKISNNKNNDFLKIKNLAEGDVICEYQLNKASKLQIRVLDISGRELRKIVDGPVGEGIQSYTINKGQLSEGIYVISVLENGIQVASKKFKL